MNRSEKLHILVSPGKLPRKYESITHVTAFSTALAALIGGLWFLDSQDPYRYLYFALTVIGGTYLGRAIAIELIDCAPSLLTWAVRVGAVLLLIAGAWAVSAGLYFTVTTRSLLFLSMAIPLVAFLTVIFANTKWARTVAYVDSALSVICILIFVREPSLLSGISAGLCSVVAGYYLGKTEHPATGPTPDGTSG